MAGQSCVLFLRLVYGGAALLGSMDIWFVLSLLPGCGGCCCSTDSQASEEGTTCRGRLTKVGQSILMYVQDYDEQFPPATPWMDAVYPYLRNERDFHCPTVFAKDNTAYGYALNSDVPGKSLAAFPDDPSKTPLAFDSTNLTRNAVEPISSVPRPGRHQGRNNIVFMDGYVESVAL